MNELKIYLIWNFNDVYNCIVIAGIMSCNLQHRHFNNYLWKISTVNKNINFRLTPCSTTGSVLDIGAGENAETA